MHHSERRARALLDRLAEKEPTGVEVGVYRGEMSHHLLTLHPSLVLFMVDDWLPSEARTERYRGTRDPRARDSASRQSNNKKRAEAATRFASERRHIIQGDSRQVARSFVDVTMDFVFIDAEHSYEAVKADIAAWLPKIRPGGLLSGHDYAPPGEYTKRGWPGVVRAVDEAVEAHGWTLDRGDQATWFVRLP